MSLIYIHLLGLSLWQVGWCKGIEHHAWVSVLHGTCRKTGQMLSGKEGKKRLTIHVVQCCEGCNKKRNQHFFLTEPRSNG